MCAHQEKIDFLKEKMCATVKVGWEKTSVPI